MARPVSETEARHGPGSASAPEVAVRLDEVSKRFGDIAAVDGVTLDVLLGEFFSILGPSGSGKTTCLRMIAGFETPTHGRILLRDRDVTNLAPYERDVNTVFQGGSRCRRLANVPVRDLAEHLDGVDGGGLAGVRSLIRRDHRHQLHLGNNRNLAQVDLPEPSPADGSPVVNVVAMVVIVLSVVPVYLAQRLTREVGGALPGGTRERNV
jgi:ABC transporter